MPHPTPITNSVDYLCNRLDTLHSLIRLYADIASSSAPGDYSVQTTVTHLLRTMKHLADQVQEVSGLAEEIQDWVYGKNPQNETEKRQ